MDTLPGADTWTNQAGFHAIFGFSARITLASCAAFLAGGYLNILDMMLMQFILKVLYEVIFLPLTLRIIRKLKAREAD